MPTPMPAVDELLRKFQGTQPSAAPPPARPATPAPAMAALGQRGPAPPSANPPAPTPAPTPPSALVALLAGALQSEAAPTAPPPPPARPRRVRADRAATALEHLLADALADPESDQRALWVSADALNDLGAGAATLRDVLARMELHATENADGRGGVLVARSTSVLAAAERSRERGEPVPIIPVRQTGRRGRRR